jgi:4-hydroxythreonine-4-phosphate dehydrogenase
MIAITPGEPAGIGPDIVIMLANQGKLANCIVIADPDLMQTRAEQLNIPVEFQDKGKNSLTILPVALKAPCIPGELNPANASYVLETLRQAAQGCLKGRFDALVTGPVHKGIINTAGMPFRGHTEFFAEIAGVSDVVMMLMSKSIKVALVTTHLPLAEVSRSITKVRLEKIIRILQADLTAKFAILNPRILICGLNPHAGEEGYLGREEIEVIKPVIKSLQKEGFNLEGPLPADTVFTPKYLEKADVILAMYHDQGLPVIKHAAFGQIANVTLGLPFVRVSVDHGTALSLAGTGKADASSLELAITRALNMVYNK